MMFSILNVFAGTPKGEPVEPFDRGIGKSNIVFIPKGTVATGVNFSYKTLDLGQAEDDLGYSMLFNVISGLKGELYTFTLAPQVSYFIADNFSVGARFDYDRSSVILDNASLSIGEDMGIDLTGYNALQHMFSSSLTGRYYMSIANSKRFAIFAELRATYGFGQGKTWQQDGDDKYGTYQIINKAALTVVPGICIFAQDNVAVEVAVGILGVDYRRTEQIRNQVQHSVMQTSGANFKINPLSIEIGTTFCIYTGQHSKKNRERK